MKYSTLMIAMLVIGLMGCSDNSGSEEESDLEYNLNLSVSPIQGGTVSPAGGQYKDGSIVQLQANASEGFLFQEWRGDLASSENPTSIRMDGNKSVSAVFRPIDVSSSCDGGVFEGDVFLGTQEEVDAFGEFCYSEITGNLYISGSLTGGSALSIVSLEALKDLEVVRELLVISSSHNLASLKGLENLKSVGLLHLSSLRSLNSIDPLSGLDYVGGIRFHFLLGISSLTPLRHLIEKTIDSNQTDFSISLVTCPKITSLDVFQGLTHLSSLNLSDMTSITTLEALNSLEEVSRDVSIRGSSPLTNLEGLDNLSHVGRWLTIDRLEALTSLKGLEGIRNVVERVQLSNNPALTDLEALGGITDVKEIFIWNNQSLNSLQGLRVEGSGIIWVESNPMLQNLEGLLMGATPPSIVQIVKNNGLTSLVGLEQIKEPYGVAIVENENLLSLEGLNGLTRVEDALIVENNLALNDLCALNMLFAQNGIINRYRIYGNAYDPSPNDFEHGRCSE